MDLLFSASFVASFFAGVAALFAPCCITVLLPTYFASIFKQRTTVFLMTFVYFLGLLTVFLPIGLGAGFLTQIFSQYHNIIFLAGAIFLIFLGVSLVTGKQLSLPSPVHPQLLSTGLGPVFVLGIFSAIATTCCAPVLAGVVALSILPGSFLWGGIYSLAYVLGMVLPLFVIALLLDKANFTDKIMKMHKTIRSYSNFFSGIMFLALGMFILYLERTNQLTTHSSYQLTINIYLSKFVKAVGTYTSILPEYVWLGIFLFITIIIVKHAVKQINIYKKGGEK